MFFYYHMALSFQVTFNSGGTHLLSFWEEVDSNLPACGVWGNLQIKLARVRYCRLIGITQVQWG